MLRPDELTDFYRDPPLLRRWYLIDGQPRCPFDAVESWAIAAQETQAVLDANAAVRARLADLLAFETALRIVDDEPPETVETADPETGTDVTIDNPAHAAWEAALATWNRLSQDETFLRDYALRHQLAWAKDEAGNDVVPDPDEPPEDDFAGLAHVPYSVTARQAIITLVAAGLWNQVQAMVEQLDPMAQVEFQRADVWRRDHPVIMALGSQLGADLNALFRQASSVP